MPVGMAALTLLASFFLKVPCIERAWDGARDPVICYSDIPAIYAARQLEGGPFPPAALEYPAGTVLFVGIAERLTSSSRGFFLVNAMALSILGLAAARALHAIISRPKRILFFALGIPLLLYAFLSWDLLALGLMILAIEAFMRRADGWAGLLTGLGAAVKLFPGVLLPAFLVASWVDARRPPGLAANEGGRSGSVRRLVLGGLAGFALPNLALLAMSSDSWRFFWEFQSERGPGLETWWFMIARHEPGGTDPIGWWAVSYPGLVNILSAVLFVIGATFLIWRAVGSRTHVGPVPLAFQLLLWFLLTSKVFSLQYSLWLLPFFVLLALPWYTYAVYVAIDLAVWAAFSGYYLAASFGTGDPSFRLLLTQVAALARYGCLLWLLILASRVPSLTLPRGAITRRFRHSRTRLLAAERH
jgi:hypothetical protein